LRPRIIPCLLVRDKGLVKSEKFNNFKYVGDPLNAVKIFNEKEVDEIMVIDIDATTNNKEPDYELIERISSQCRMPLSYGGGIKTVEQAKIITSLGVEKVCLSSKAISNPEVLNEISSQIGVQSTVGVIDFKKKPLLRGYNVFTHNGKINTKKSPLEVALQMQKSGCGEIVLNSIDLDGTKAGFDLNILKQVFDSTTIPITILGGAGSIDHFRKALIEVDWPIGLSAGSYFVFKGKFRAVLIDYLSNEEKQKLCSVVNC
jgi:cyclase